MSPAGPCLPDTPRMSQNPLLRWSLIIARMRSLIEVLAEIPDFRKQQGKRHALSAMLALACCAMLCGYRSYSAIAEPVKYEAEWAPT